MMEWKGMMKMSTWREWSSCETIGDSFLDVAMGVDMRVRYGHMDDVVHVDMRVRYGHMDDVVHVDMRVHYGQHDSPLRSTWM